MGVRNCRSGTSQDSKGAPIRSCRVHEQVNREALNTIARDFGALRRCGERAKIASVHERGVALVLTLSTTNGVINLELCPSDIPTRNTADSCGDAATAIVGHHDR